MPHVPESPRDMPRLDAHYRRALRGGPRAQRQYYQQAAATLDRWIPTLRTELAAFETLLPTLTTPLIRAAAQLRRDELQAGLSQAVNCQVFCREQLGGKAGR